MTAFMGIMLEYSKACLPIATQLIDSDRLKISDLYDGCSVERVGEDILRQVDENLESFININTPQDLLRLGYCI